MTALTVLYLKHTRHPLAALTTAVPGAPPSLDPSATLRLSPPVATAQNFPIPTPPVAPGSVRTRQLTLKGADVAIAVVEAEFDDPLEVFEWRVVTTTAPDGTTQYRLDRMVTVQIGANLQAGTTLKLEVPRLGGHDQLQYEVHETSGMVASGTLAFPTTASAQATLTVPGHDPPVVLVEGYPPAVARKNGAEPDWP
jgi:hypothetical protein